MYFSLGGMNERNVKVSRNNSVNKDRNLLSLTNRYKKFLVQFLVCTPKWNKIVDISSK